MEFLGIKWVGVTPENGQKLLLSLAFVTIVVVVSRTLRWLVGLALRKTDHSSIQTKFWTRQGISLLSAIILILGLLSIWFSDPTRLATALGLVSAGLAFALQQPVTSIAGYFVILRGATFNVGDRISMGASGAMSSASALSRPRLWKWDNRPAFRAQTPRCGSRAGSSPDAS